MYNWPRYLLTICSSQFPVLAVQLILKSTMPIFTVKKTREGPDQEEQKEEFQLPNEVFTSQMPFSSGVLKLFFFKTRN